MKDWITLPRTEGIASRQAHADLPDGTYERELGRAGFAGPATHMYHRHPPTSWSAWEGPLRPRAFDLGALETTGGGPWRASLLLHNGNTGVRFWRSDSDMDCLVRNGDGDDLIFIHEGRGDFFTDYGHMAFSDGDYLLVPRGTMWRVEIEEPLSALMIEATGAAFGLPEKGLVGNHAIFDPAVLDYPRIDDPFLVQQGEGEWRVEIKRHGEISTVTYPFNPLDAVGWTGSLVPLKLNWRHIRPLMSHRYHLPPSAHTTFVADGLVVSTFCPRPLETDPGALKVPFFHSNDDFDEVIFYHRGQFFSRDHITPGMMTLHPSGFPHGPHPKAFAVGAEGSRKETDEVAVMLDTAAALNIAPPTAAIEWQGYVDSWKE